jgi:nitrogen-specific signal transduction histidine kinase/CheY-like chemotaxis protein
MPYRSAVRVDGEDILYVVRSLIFTVVFWLASQTSSLFDVSHSISAFYMPTGLSVAFIAAFGWRYIPAVVIAVLFASSPNPWPWGFGEEIWFHVLRRIVVYGCAGVLFGQVWREQSQRFSLTSAIALFFVAIAASLLSAIAAYKTLNDYDLVPKEALGSVFLSFWGGDFAGVMLVAPIALILSTQLAHRSVADLIQSLYVATEPKHIWLQLGCILTAIASLQLPFQLGASGEFIFICAIPIAIAGLWVGVIQGIAATWLTAITIMMVQNLGGIEYSNAIDIQLFIGLSASLALMAGGSRDDRERAQATQDRLRRELHDYASSSSDWFWQTDSEHRFSYISDGPVAFVGAPIDYDYGKSRAELTHEDIRSPKWQDHLTALQERKPFKDFTYPWCGPDGVTKYVSASGIPIFEHDGTFAGYRGTISDVSQLRQAQKMEAVGQLTSGITHDFNNVLHVILANMEIVKKVYVDEKSSKRINSTIAAVARGANLTEQLLSFSRTDSTNTDSLSVTDTIRNMDDLIAKSLSASKRVEFELDQDVWLILADGGELQDAILNLSINANHAMANDGLLTIQTSNCRRSGDYVMISVTDNGAGMTQEVLSKIFDPFFTTKERGRGTGLGLSMVDGYVRRSGGHIEVESELGQGTAFRIYLPRSISGGAEAAINHSGSKRALPGRETILVVEDEIDISETTQNSLEALGYSIVTAANGASALEFLEKPNAIDLLFSDVAMPGKIDGFELARLCGKLHPNMPILLASGIPNPGAPSFADEDAGFEDALRADMLSKPYTVAELTHAIRKSVDNRQIKM